MGAAFVPQPTSRNAACPCGSGRRYKDCHGALDGRDASSAASGPVAAMMGEARQRLAAGDMPGAEARSRDVLAQQPDQPEALRILGRCAYDRGRVREALRYALDAARALESHPLAPPDEFAVWSDLNFMFTQSLPGLDSMVAERKRADCVRDRDTAVETGLDETLVGVVLVVPGGAGSAIAALRSVAAQTHRRVELTIAYAGPDPRGDAAFAAALRDGRFAPRWVEVPGASAATLADAGVRASAGAFVNVVTGSVEFTPTRLARMLRAVGGGWGFSNVAFVDAGDRPLLPDQDAQVAAWSERLAAIPEADTVGHAFIHQEFVAVDGSNLFFARVLYDEAGGFRDRAQAWAWDFCLRALPLAEPVFVPSAEVVVRIVDPTPAPRRRSADVDAAQVAMFAAYYADACRDDCVPRNRFAPCVAHWRLHFLKTVFQTGHVLAFPLATLERLGAAVLGRLDDRANTALDDGVDLVGFAFGEFGLGENLRAFAMACIDGGIPFGVKDVDMRLKTRQADRSIAVHIEDALTHRCAVFCLNPDMMKPIRGLVLDGAAAGRYNVGYWFWELEQVPREWRFALDDVDEIWVATEFVADAMRGATPKPVVKIPTPIKVTLSRPYTRAEFGLPDGRFLFLFSFDFNSFSARKNPEGGIAAFKRAFGPARRSVGLVIKSINGAGNPEKMRALRDLIGGDTRIAIVDGFMSRDQVSGLQSVVDAYVSLHRAEGLGLGLAESMYQGKPVIGTRYSGNLEFMDDDNSCLVDCTLVPIRKGEYLYDDERFRWADPDVGQAARWMQRLVDDAGFRTRIAARGRHDIRTRFTHANAAALMRHRLSELGLMNAGAVADTVAVPRT
ncbi:MAG: SEC-C metal-binding domain-containing protein [Betaproteobacteria bacterium]